MDADKSLPAAEVPLDELLCPLRIADNNEIVAAAEQTPPATTTTTKAGNEDATMVAPPPPAGEIQMLCDFCAMKCCTCGCPQLEAEPVRNNEELWHMQVRSRDIDWSRYVRPLDTGVRGRAVYLDTQVYYMNDHRRPQTMQNKRELLICHDMMGNYLADRHFISSEKYDDYRFVHWSGVDYFCYFSHEYITIPPSGWLNAAHRHGVPVLGTYIVEGDTGSRLLYEMLASEESVQRTVDGLTRLCRHFRFEGWLVNVECPLRAESMPNLYRFVEKLRDATEQLVPHGRVFWYDSVIDDGQLNWQNELNERNVRFFRLSHGTLINYNWNDASLATTGSSVEREKVPLNRVFMGLDVFGRGQLARFQSDKTLERIAKHGFSAGIFAPAWCYETLQSYGYNIRTTAGDESLNDAFLARNERWWSRLWEWLGTHPYCQLPFYTDFCVGSGRGNYVCGSRQAASRPFFNLARQALQPSVPLGENAQHSFDTAYAGGSALRVENYELAFRLFLTQFEIPLGVLLLSYAYRMDADAQQEDALQHSLDVVLRCSTLRHSEQDLFLFCGQYSEHFPMMAGMCYLRPVNGAQLPRALRHAQLPTEPDALGDNWRVAYYLMHFDGPFIVQDIGLRCQRPNGSKKNAYFGAIYVQSLRLEDWLAARDVEGKAEIPAYQRRLWKGSGAGQ